MEKQTDRPGLSDEDRVFAECIEDILRSTPGIRYEAFFDPTEIGSRDKMAFALFVIETNPVHDLSLSIELTREAFIVHVGSLSFCHRRGHASRFEWWVERRCRDLTSMVNGDLRLEQETLLTVPLTSTLWAGRRKKWRKVGTQENGWLRLVSFFLPFGLFITTGEKRTFTDWIDSGE